MCGACVVKEGGLTLLGLEVRLYDIYSESTLDDNKIWVYKLVQANDSVLAKNIWVGGEEFVVLERGLPFHGIDEG